MFKQRLPSTLIAEANHIQGDLVFNSKASIDGTIEGNVQTTSNDPLFVKKSGVVIGNIDAAGPIHIEGSVRGNIASKELVCLSSTAVFCGKICSPKLDISPGASVNSEVCMEQPAEVETSMLLAA